MKPMDELVELTSSAETDSWIPEDVYADLFFDGVLCYGQLSGVITAMEYDFTAGGGNLIQVRAMAARTTSCTSYGGAGSTHYGCSPCLSIASASLKTYQIPVRAWGDRDLVCGFTIWETDFGLVSKILNEMGKRQAQCRDLEIWSNISADIAAAGINLDIETNVGCNEGMSSGSVSCCTWSYNLYNSIVSAKQHLKGDSYHPDYVVMHPEVAQHLYMKDGSGYPLAAMPGLKYNNDGELTTIVGLTVIECCNAATCGNTAGAVMAVVLDSSRAVGEVWGKHPTFTEFYDGKCDSHDEVVWQYWGSAALDGGAIIWISNP